MLKHHSHNPAATKIIWSGRGLLNIVNLGPLDEDLEALTHWQDEENTFLESQQPVFKGTVKPNSHKKVFVLYSNYLPDEFY